MSDAFHLLDLVSQAAVVKRLLRGTSPEEKLSWLSARGKITKMHKTRPEWPDTYYFESPLGGHCAFVIQGDDFLFAGDHHFFTTPKEEDTDI